jgi:formate-dependent phosphoribosylglycinamide formyltransferase (GAR transformylase)
MAFGIGTRYADHCNGISVRRRRGSKGRLLVNKYVQPIEQLVTEIVVRDIKRSTEFYRRLGFQLLRDGDDFVELT